MECVDCSQGVQGDGVAESLGMIVAQLIVHCTLEDKALDVNRRTVNAIFLDTIVSCRSL